MEPTTPFWFKQRQCKLEAAGEQQFKVTAPNLVESFLRVEPAGENRWRAALRRTVDGADLFQRITALPLDSRLRRRATPSRRRPSIANPTKRPAGR